VLKPIFRAMDEDLSGSLDYDEFAKAMRRHPRHGTGPHAATAHAATAHAATAHAATANAATTHATATRATAAHTAAAHTTATEAVTTFSPFRLSLNELRDKP
jgi:hypothetical protein